MKTYGQEIWEKKMQEQGTLGVVGGVVNSKSHQDKAMREICTILNLEVFNLLNGKDVLDVGIGDGRFLIRFNELGFNCDGVDVSQSVINFVGDKIKDRFNSLLYLKDITREPVLKKYDLVFCTGTFGHFPSFLAKDTLLNFKSMLKENGVIYIAFWKTKELNIKNILHTFIYDSLRLFKGNKYTVNCSFYSKEDIKDLASLSNLKVIKIIETKTEYLTILQ